jgi:hypothetical protein
MQIEVMVDEKTRALLDGLARMVETIRDGGMVRSNPMMPVREHRVWLTTIADNIRKGIVAL